MSFARSLFHDIPDLNTRGNFGGSGRYSGQTMFAVYLFSGGALILNAKSAFAPGALDALTS